MHRRTGGENIWRVKGTKEIGSTSRPNKEGKIWRVKGPKEIGSTSRPNKEEEREYNEGEKRNEMLMQMQSWKLPQDITSDILLRLPIKSVMRCRCVCKAWRTLLHNPHFINMHLTRSSEAKNPSLLLFTIDITSGGKRNDPNPVIHVSYNVYLIERMLELGVTDQPISPLQVPKYNINAACNGLLCLSSFWGNNDVTILISNPFTRETVRLPRSNAPFDNGNGTCGLGYHPRTKEYKVLGVVFLKGKDMAQVHTLGSSSWRSKGQVPSTIMWRPFNVLVNGALHWLAYYPNKYSKNVVITSFDIGDEMFRVLPIPPESCLVDKWQYKQVQELGGFLSLVDFSSRYRVDIWVMKHYGVEESWNKQFVVPIPELVESVSLLWHLEGGEVLLRYNEAKFVSYDPNNDQIRHLAVQVPAHTTIHSFVHVGSLISPESLVSPRLAV